LDAGDARLTLLASMKRRLLDLLVCPKCKGQLQLQPEAESGAEIVEGSLCCTQGHSYRIVKGVPRFVPAEFYAESFGFQWNRFSRVQLDVFNHTKESEMTFQEKTNFDVTELPGKLVLDAGTGAGRFADVVSRMQAEVVGVDLSTAVEAAHLNLGERPNVHFVQADIFQLPFKEKIFDNIFSIGVLHHTPDTRKAFNSLIPILRPNGEIAIWVYSRHSELRKISDTLRKGTVKMPRKLLFYASTVAIPLYYLKPLRLIFQGAFRICMHRNWRWRWLDTFDYFSPRYQWKHTYPEVFSWFQEAGLSEITPLPAPVSMKGKAAS
jgi:SAM-dependent methyltransferase